GVDLDGGLVLGRDVYIFEDRVHRTDDLALLAIDTHFGIDIELRSSGFRVDAGDRADFDTCSIVGAQTGDDVRHSLIFLYQVQNVQQLLTGSTDWNDLNVSVTHPVPAANRCESHWRRECGCQISKSLIYPPHRGCRGQRPRPTSRRSGPAPPWRESQARGSTR